METASLTVFVTSVFPICCKEEHHRLRFITGKLSNDLAQLNPFPSPVLLNSPAEVKS